MNEPCKSFWKDVQEWVSHKILKIMMRNCATLGRPYMAYASRWSQQQSGSKIQTSKQQLLDDKAPCQLLLSITLLTGDQASQRRKLKIYVCQGWAHFIDGCTVYISPRHEETLDPDDSVILNPGSVPIVSIRQRKHKKLSYPYRQRYQKVVNWSRLFIFFTAQKVNVLQGIQRFWSISKTIQRSIASTNALSILLSENVNA